MYPGIGLHNAKTKRYEFKSGYCGAANVPDKPANGTALAKSLSGARRLVKEKAVHEHRDLASFIDHPGSCFDGPLLPVHEGV